PDAALAAADDDDVRLHRAAELLGLALARLEPRLALPVGAVLDALRAADALALLVALELLQRRQQRERLAVLQAQEPGAATDLGLELDPRGDDALFFRRVLGRVEAVWFHVGEARLEHRLDLLGTLDGLDVPRERDEVAPEARVEEQLGRRGSVAG